MDKPYFKPVPDARRIRPYQRCVVSGLRVPDHQGLQQIGEMTFYAGGDVRLGEHCVGCGVALDGLVFSGGYTAYRRWDEPNFLYVHEPGAVRCRTFEYRWLERTWYEHVPAKCPEFDRCVDRFGPVLGKFVYKWPDRRRRAIIGCLELVRPWVGMALLLALYGVLVGLLWLACGLVQLAERVLTWLST